MTIAENKRVTRQFIEDAWTSGRNPRSRFIIRIAHHADCARCGGSGPAHDGRG